MAMSPIIIFVLMSLFYAGTAQEPEPVSNKWKFIAAKVHTDLAVYAIRDISLNETSNGVQIRSMANELILELNYIVYSLNILTSTVFVEELRLALVSSSEVLNKIANTLQSVINKDVQVIKDTLVSSVTEIKEGITEIIEMRVEEIRRHIWSQVSKIADLILHSAAKLRIHASRIENSAVELNDEIESAVTDLQKVAQESVPTDQYTEEIIRHMLEHFGLVIVKAVTNIQNWVDSNKGNIDNDLVSEVAISDEYHKIQDVIGSANSATYMKIVLKKHFESVSESISKLAHRCDNTTIGYTEYIRSLQFDILAIGELYSTALYHIGNEHVKKTTVEIVRPAQLIELVEE